MDWGWVLCMCVCILYWRDGKWSSWYKWLCSQINMYRLLTAIPSSSNDVLSFVSLATFVIPAGWTLTGISLLHQHLSFCIVCLSFSFSDDREGIKFKMKKKQQPNSWSMCTHTIFNIVGMNSYPSCLHAYCLRFAASILQLFHDYYVCVMAFICRAKLHL